MKRFIELNEITEEMLINKNAMKHLYKKVVNEIENEDLFLDDYKIEKMYVIDMDNKKIVEALFNGFSVKTYFYNYNEERFVDATTESFSVIDEEGNEYDSKDYVILRNKEAAEEMLKEALTED